MNQAAQPATLSPDAPRAPTGSPDWSTMRSRYMVPDDIVYLNNGSYGPTPRVVYEGLLLYLKQLEENPSVYGEQYNRLQKVVKPKLAAFLGCDPERMAIVVNLTFGMNVLSRGIRGLSPGDEVLTTNQEYGAVNNIWDFAAQKQGLVVRHVHIPTLPESPQQIVRIIEEGITPRTRIIYASHVTSPTGLVLPVKEISALARSRGILSFIDGAHAPGMLRVDIRGIGCDFYTGNCHKWLGAPKGTAFIAMHPRSWERIEPYLVGWGWSKDKAETFDGNFENPGIHNTALPNAIGEAVDFQLGIGTQNIEARGRELAEYGKDLFLRIPGVKLLTPRDPAMCGSMAAFSLPAVEDDTRFTEALRKRRIVVPAGANSAGGRMRVSTHIYNSREDLHVLDEALREIYRA
jgi:isopenicillin-N epimerase